MIMPTNEVYPADATLEAMTEETETGVQLVADNTLPGDDLFLKVQQLFYRLLLATRRANDLRVFDEGALDIGVKAGQFWDGATLRTYAGSTGNTLADEKAAIYVYINASGTLVINEYSAWPDPATTNHIRLAVVTTSGGDITGITDARGGHVFSSFKQPDARGGFIPVPLTALREVVSNDVPNAAEHGGTLAKDTTPILEFISGDTDSCLRLNWAASNADPVMFQVPIPPDLDEAQDITLHCRIASAGTTNAVGFDVDSYFNEGDTKVEDATQTNQTATYADKTATIAAADIPAGAATLTCELTPVAHATDALYLTAVWLTYKKV